MEGIKEIFTDLFKVSIGAAKEFFSVTDYSKIGWLVLFPMKVLIFLVMYPIWVGVLFFVACIISVICLVFFIIPDYIYSIAKKVFYK